MAMVEDKLFILNGEYDEGSFPSHELGPHALESLVNLTINKSTTTMMFGIGY